MLLSMAGLFEHAVAHRAPVLERFQFVLQRALIVAFDPIHHAQHVVQAGQSAPRPACCQGLLPGRAGRRRRQAHMRRFDSRARAPSPAESAPFQPGRAVQQVVASFGLLPPRSRRHPAPANFGFRPSARPVQGRADRAGRSARLRAVSCCWPGSLARLPCQRGQLVVAAKRASHRPSPAAGLRRRAAISASAR